jgi:transcriptional regulator with XRE-family HTH domain
MKTILDVGPTALRDYVRLLRAEREWKLEILARQAGINIGTLSELETGKLPMSSAAARRLLHALLQGNRIRRPPRRDALGRGGS